MSELFTRDGDRKGRSVWSMPIGGFERNGYLGSRWLVLDPTIAAVTTRLFAWVEQTCAYRVWRVPYDANNRRPKGPAGFEDRREEVDRSRISVPVEGAGWIVVRALARNELIGQSAHDGVYNLFWSHFIARCEGARYLARYSKETGRAWAREHMKTTSAALFPEKNGIPNVVAVTIDAIMSDRPLFGCKVLRRLKKDPNLYDALDAVLQMHKPPEEENAHIKQILRNQSWKGCDQ